MIPKPIALGPTFPASVPLKGELAGPSAEGFAHEVLAAIRAPARPPGKRASDLPSEVPPELPWAALLAPALLPQGAPVSPELRSESQELRPELRPESRPEIRSGLQPREIPKPTTPVEARPAGPVTRLLREVRQDWVAMPMPEAGPAPEVSWVQQEPAPVEAEALSEAETPIEAPQVQLVEEPVAEGSFQRSLSEMGVTLNQPDAPEPPEPLELLEVPEPELEPLPPAFERESVRIRVDGQLAVEVTTRGRHVDVLISGSAQAVDPLRDLGPELGSQLMQDGYSLDDFQARDEDHHSSRQQDPDEEQPQSRPRARRTSRGGRYA